MSAPLAGEKFYIPVTPRPQPVLDITGDKAKELFPMIHGYVVTVIHQPPKVYTGRQFEIEKDLWLDIKSDLAL